MQTYSYIIKEKSNTYILYIIEIPLKYNDSILIYSLYIKIYLAIPAWLKYKQYYELPKYLQYVCSLVANL